MEKMWKENRSMKAKRALKLKRERTEAAKPPSAQHEVVPPSLRQQIKAVEEAAESNHSSYTHLIGSYTGRIPPGPELDHTLALEAAVKTLRQHRG